MRTVKRAIFIDNGESYSDWSVHGVLITEIERDISEELDVLEKQARIKYAEIWELYRALSTAQWRDDNSPEKITYRQKEKEYHEWLIQSLRQYGELYEFDDSFSISDW